MNVYVKVIPAGASQVSTNPVLAVPSETYIECP